MKQCLTNWVGVMMEYALAGIDNNLFAARYQLYLPNKAELQAQLNQLMEN